MESLERQRTLNITSLLYMLIIAGLVVVGYYDVFGWIYGRYMGEDSYYSHGFLIPFVTAYLIWFKKEELYDTSKSSSSLGLFLIIFAILTHVFGTAVYVFSISGFSIWFLVMGVALFLYGRKITKIILFPLFFLLFMFPLPSAIITMISFPLKVLVAKVVYESKGRVRKGVAFQNRGARRGDPAFGFLACWPADQDRAPQPGGRLSERDADGSFDHRFG